MIPGITASVRTAVASTLEFDAPLTSSLTLDTGAYTPTFVRATTATVEDFEGLVKDVLSGESRHQGARRVENRITGNSEDLTDDAWVKTSVTVDSATLFTPTASLGGVRQNTATLEGNEYTYSFWARVVSGNTSLQIQHGASASGNSTLKTITATLTRYSVTVLGKIGGGDVLFGLRDANGAGFGQIEFTEVQIENVTGQSNQNPGEYVSVGVATGSELVTNGTFDSDTTGWNPVADATLSVVAGRIRVTKAATDWARAVQSFPTKIGKTYQLSVGYINRSSSFSCGVGISGVFGNWSTTSTSQKGTFVATATSSEVQVAFNSSSGSPGDWIDADDISVKEADHGANVDSVQYFEYENGNTVTSNVVDETGQPGTALTTLDGILIEEQRTSYADTTDDLTGGADTIDLTAGGTGDFTLSVSSDAAVTVAAVGATGTGFGQATAGSPVTFNLSVTGTVSLTLNSGTLTTNANGEFEYNLEPGSFATSWIPTAGTPTTRNADVLTYDYQPPALLGSLLATVNYGGYLTSENFYALQNNGGCRWIYTTSRINATDGGGINYNAGGDYTGEKNLGLTWEDGASPEVATYDTGSQYTTTTLTADGFVSGSDPLSVGCASGSVYQMNGTIKEVKFYTDAKDQTFMEAAT